MTSTLHPLSGISIEERSWLQGFIAEEPILSLYFDTALEDLANGIDNRLVLIGRQRRGFILGIAFDAVDVFSLFGHLEVDEMRTLASHPRRAEICVQPALVETVRSLCAARIEGVFEMRVYTRTTEQVASEDARCRRLTAADLQEASAFYAAHYPQTVFSGWMLDLPFLAIFGGGRIIAAAGVLAIGRRSRRAIIGNFLTDPMHRGRGLAKAVGRSLISALRAEGIDQVALVTTGENTAAARAYEALGFCLAERWVQLDLKPVN